MGNFNWIFPLFVINSADELYKWKYIFIMQIIPLASFKGAGWIFYYFHSQNILKGEKNKVCGKLYFFPLGEKGEKNLTLQLPHKSNIGVWGSQRALRKLEYVCVCVCGGNLILRNTILILANF